MKMLRHHDFFFENKYFGLKPNSKNKILYNAEDVFLLDRGVGGPPDIGNEIAEMIGFPESVG